MSSGTPAFLAKTCNSPAQYYSCSSNGFKGCCLVNPCNSSGCPNGQSGNADNTDVATTELVPSSTTVIKFSTSSSPSLAVTSSPPAATSRGNAFQVATLLVPSPAASTASSGNGPSIVLITSVVLTSQEIITPTSEGVALAPASSTITSTTLSSFSTSITQTSVLSSPHTSASSGAATSSTPTPSSSTSHSTVTIAGPVGGVGGAIISALLIWLLIRWQRTRRGKEMRAVQHDDDPRLQGIDANRAGSAFKEDDGPPPYRANAVAASTDPIEWNTSSPISPLSPVNQREPPTSTATLMNNRHSTNGTRSHLGRGAAGTIPNAANTQLELYGDSAPSISELSPSPERSAINTPTRRQVPAFGNNGSVFGGSPLTDGSAMQPNLDPTMGSPAENQHVMSWMNYDGGTPSPAR